MFGSDVLEVAIGLALVFLTASLVCTAAKEGLEAILRKRGQFLKGALGELLNGPDGKLAGADWVARFYTHPLISSLYLGRFEPDTSRNLPSYIPSGSFASTIMDLVCQEAAKSARQKAELEKSKAGAPNEEIAAAGEAAAAAFRLDPVNPLESLRKGLGEFPEGHLKESLRVILNESGKELAAVKTSLEGWFNDSMNRVAGSYKRHTQWTIFIIAAVVTLSLNLNAVTVTRKLINDSALRKTLVARAEVYARENASPPPLVSPDPGAPKATNAPALASGVETAATKVYELGLPIGWEQFTAPDSLGGWVSLMAGYLATMFAISMGAPFWFDLLNKVVQVSAAVSPSAAVKKAKEGEEKPAPPRP